MFDIGSAAGAGDEPASSAADDAAGPVLRVVSSDGELDVAATLAALLDAPPSSEVLSVASGLVGRAELTPEQLVVLAEVGERCKAWVEAVFTYNFAALDDVAGPRRSSGYETGMPDRRDQLVTETAMALRWSDGMVQTRFSTATVLLTGLPGTLGLLEAGAISWRHALAVIDGAELLTVADADRTAGQRAELERRVLPRAPEQTRAELARAVSRAVIRIDPEAAERRRETTRAQRSVERVRGVQDIDQAAILRAVGPAEDTDLIWAALSLGGEQLKAAGLVQTLGQGRYDTLRSWATDYLGSQHLAAPGTRPVGVAVVVKASTLAGEDDDPAELVGYGPITAQTARDLATGVAPRPGPFRTDLKPEEEDYRWQWATPARAYTADEALPAPPPDPADADRQPPDGWHDDDPDPGPGPGREPDPPRGPPSPAGHSTTQDRHDARLVSARTIRIDPDSGYALPPDGLRLVHGRARRLFPAELTDHVRDLYRRCVMPGCAMPVTRTEGDHGEGWANDGATDLTNAYPTCPHHNRITRTGGAWTITPNGDGTATLTTPHGRTYLIEPHNYLDD